MVVGHKNDVSGKLYQGENVKGAVKKILVGPDQGWDGWVMRLFELEPGGYTPRHTHDWPHINYVARGEGVLHLEGEDIPIREGSYAYVPSNALHQFMNTSDAPLEFVCIVPEKGDEDVSHHA